MVPNASVHRKIVRGGALLLMLAGCFLICAPALIPDLPVLPAVLWFQVSLAHQRPLVSIAGVLCLIEGLALFVLNPVGWWVAMILGPVGILHGIINATRFLNTLLDILVFCYLYFHRDIFWPAGRSKEPAA